MAGAAFSATSGRIELTARDFDSYKAALIQYLRDRVPDDFTDFTESQLGIVIVELVAYLGGNLAYYQNRIANETYLSTARERKNVVRIARLIGYTPSLATAASVDLFLDVAALSLTADETITFAAGASISSQDGVTFALDQTYVAVYTFGADSWTVNGVARGQSPYVSAVEGTSSQETFSGTGQPFQQFLLSSFPVISGSIEVRVDGVLWTEAESLVLPDDPDDPRIYEVVIDARDRATVQTGDDITGQVVPDGASVEITYRTGGGKRGNVSAYRIVANINGTGLVAGSISVPVTNPNPASGGQERESLDSIKFFAPAFLKTNDRAVTRNDYATLSAGFSDGQSGAVKKAGVFANPTDGKSNVVTVYAWTADSDNVLVANVPQPLKDALHQFLHSRRVATVFVQVQNGTNVPVDVTVKLRVDSSFRADSVRSNVGTALADLFRQTRVRYGNQLRYSWIVDTVMGVPGVKWCHVTSPVCEVEAGTLQELEEGTLLSQAGAASNELILPASSSSVDGYYCNYRVEVSIAGLLSTRKVVAYTGSTRTAELEVSWDAASVPSSGDTYRVWHPRLAKLAGTASTTDDFYNYRTLSIAPGGDEQSTRRQTRFVVDYQKGAPDHEDGDLVVRVDSNWNLQTPPDKTTTYLMLADMQCRESEALVAGTIQVDVLSGDDESGG